MSKYIIMLMTMDADHEDIFGVSDFGLACPKAYDTLEEAIAARDERIETDVANFQGLWVEEDGYCYDTGKMNEKPDADIYIDVYNNGDVVKETIYKIQKIDYATEKEE